MEIQDTSEIQIDFVDTPYLNHLIDRIMLYLKAGFPIHLRGPAGTGKTTLAFHIAKLLKQPFIIVYGCDDVEISDLIGGYLGFRQETIVDRYIRSVEKRIEYFRQDWIDGMILTACKYGYTLIYDEFTRSKPEVNNILLPILEEKIVKIHDHENERFVKVHPNFKAIFTSNPVEYSGVHKTQDALLDRIISVNLLNIDFKTEVTITAVKTGITFEEAEQIVSIITAVRNFLKGKVHPSIRGSIMIGQVIKQNKIPVDVNNKTFMEICSDILNTEFVECYTNQQVQKIIYEALRRENKR